MKAGGITAGLRKLQSLEMLHASCLGEEKPGLLRRLLEGISSLHLRLEGRGPMRCGDIASPNLRCLTVLKHHISKHGGLPGANIPTNVPQVKHSLEPSELRQALCVCMVHSCALDKAQFGAHRVKRGSL